MGRTTKIDRETLKNIQIHLHASSDDLQKAKLDPVGQGDFGGSSPGSTLADDVSRARHHVLAAAQQMAGGVGGLADALKNAVNIADETEGQVQTDIGTIDSSVGTIGMHYADPSYRARRHQSTDGRTP